MLELTINIGSLSDDTTANDTRSSLRLLEAGIPVEAGTVGVTINKPDGTPCDGVTWPVAHTHTEDGVWQGIIPKELEWCTDEDGVRIAEAIITAVANGKTRTLPATVRFIRG